MRSDRICFFYKKMEVALYITANTAFISGDRSEDIIAASDTKIVLNTT